ncbi:MAG: RES family NAD+ phosphorylase [Pseudomonadales bacterium]
MNLAPAGLQHGRFCLVNGIAAYLADNEKTALYESIFRREQKITVALSDLRSKSLGKFVSQKSLRLVDVRGLEQEYPYLHSLRIELTQAFAQECSDAGFHGVLYSSAQHSQNECVCLFELGAKKLALTETWNLVKPGTNIILDCVADAAERSGVVIT